MARPLRLEFPGAVYHVTARGHDRTSIFREEADREKFLALLSTVRRDFGWEIHAYCLMGNHYHLLVETPMGDLSRGMKTLNGRYAQWFNGRHRRRGYLLEGRFRSVLVQKDSHLLELHRYVALNPVRAGLVDRAGDWKWSSYRATAGLGKPPEWLETDWTLGQFARSRAAAREAFRRFVAEGRGGGKEVEALERGGLLGDEAFAAGIRARLRGREISDEIPLRFRKPAAAVGLDEIRRTVARSWNVPERALARRRGGDEKKAAIYLARKLTRLGGREIGAAFGVKPARVSNVVTEIESEPSTPLARKLERLRAGIEKRSS
ncbi:MAG: REP-associated tyrosine transposase [Acidobacteriota bacterium]